MIDRSCLLPRFRAPRRLAFLLAAFALTLALQGLADVAAQPATPPGGVSSCGPSMTGSPCAGAGVATQGNRSGMAEGVGNPIHLITGNKSLTHVDLPALPGPLGLELVRHYNSVHSGPRAPTTGLGRGWRWSYDTQLAVGARTVQVLQADGTRLSFHRDPQSPGTCAGEDASQGHLQLHGGPSDERYEWHWPDGRVLRFDPRGFLVQVLLPTGEHLTLVRDSRGNLLSAEDPQGRRMVFRYPAHGEVPGFRGVADVQTPVGRFAYRYGSKDSDSGASANLVAVVSPTSEAVPAVRRYHHEDTRHPTLITGFSVSGPDGHGGAFERRVASYGYAPDGRAIWSVPGAPDQTRDRIDLDFSQAGVTIVRSGPDATTRIEHGWVGGERRILRMTGSACTGCGPVPMSFGHDGVGRLVRATSLDPQGRPARSWVTERDAQGRVSAQWLVQHRAAEPDALRLLARYRYQGMSPAPVEVIRPSLAAGRQHRLVLEYGDAGQLVRSRETGYSPIDAEGRAIPVDAQGRIAAADAARATPIEREIRHRHARINGRTVTVEIDGPLPNGPRGDPSDSDVIRLHWDRLGRHIERVEAPLREPVTWHHDEAGRPVQRTDGASEAPDGKARLTWRWDPLGRPLELRASRPGATEQRVVRWRHDALGRLVAQDHGIDRGGRWQPALDDSEWRLGESQDASSIWRATADGRVDRWGVVDAASASARAIGLPLEVPAPPDAVPQAPQGTAIEPIRWRVDDFGRHVARLSPDHGTRVFTYDAAGRLVATADPMGRRTQYAWDLRNRLTGRTLPAADPEERPRETRWIHQGDQVVRIEDPIQTEHRGHDAWGRLIERRVEWRAPGAGKGWSSKQRWRYDALGRPVATSLPDGSWLVWRRDGHGRVVGLERERLGTGWLHGLLPRQVLVADIRRDRHGLQRVELGNGIAAQWWRSPDGALARVWHAPSSAVAPQGRDRPSAARLSRPSWMPEVSRPHGLAPVSGLPLANGGPGEAPGWWGRPAIPGSIVDHRFLWSSSGRLLHLEDRSSGEARVWHALHDPAGRLLQWQRQAPDDSASAAATGEPGSPGFHRYVYDRHGRRTGWQTAGGTLQRADHADGSHRMIRWGDEAGAVVHDELGQPLRWRGHALRWDAAGRLVGIDAEGPRPVRYAYGVGGERVWRDVGGSSQWLLHDERRRAAELDGQGRVQRMWLWLADLPVAVIDFDPASAPRATAAGPAATTLWRDARILWRAATARAGDAAEQTHWLHVDHLGAPVAATDDQGAVRWRAEREPFGRTHVLAGSTLKIDLRLPGQYEDPETGLHHNDHRFYDPDLGRYLSPDPLGSPDGPDPYAYVRHDPLRHIDPSGLVLWAFDGTSNQPNSETNVWHFAGLYGERSAYDHAHGIHGRSHYVPGPGVMAQEDGTFATSWSDAAMALSLMTTLQTQMEVFTRYVSDNWSWSRSNLWATQNGRVRITLDVVGFSRGAAVAREFSHRVADWRRGDEAARYGGCLEVIQRLLALFDTVLSIHSRDLSAQAGPGRAAEDNPLPAARPASQGTMRMHVPSEVEVALHAVAMNERRRLFWLESLHPSAGAMGNDSPVRIEVGFVGSHSDIGGGYNGTGNQTATGGDLSDITLNWMIQQSRLAGVRFDDVPFHLQQVTSPIAHDSARELHWWIFGQTLWSTRSVRFTDPNDPTGDTAAERRQNELRWPNGMSQTRAEDFIAPRSSLGWQDPRHGRVFICRYAEWLRAEYGLRLPAQPGCDA